MRGLGPWSRAGIDVDVPAWFPSFVVEDELVDFMAVSDLASHLRLVARNSLQAAQSDITVTS